MSMSYMDIRGGMYKGYKSQNDLRSNQLVAYNFNFNSRDGEVRVQGG